MKKIVIAAVLAILASIGVTIQIADDSPVSVWTSSAQSARSLNAEV